MDTSNKSNRYMNLTTLIHSFSKMYLIQKCKRFRKHNDRLLFSAMLLPAAYLTLIYIFDNSQINIFETLMTQSGNWALIFYILSYTISPFQRLIIAIAKAQKWLFGKRLTDWNFLLTHRRTLGLASFHLCVWHFLFYFYLELNFLLDELLYELTHRIAITAGMVAFIVMAVLFITSFKWAKRRLGRNWQRIHNTTHVIVIAVILHVVWITKLLQWYHYIYICSLFLLMTERMVQFLRGRNHRFFERQRRRRKHRKT